MGGFIEFFIINDFVDFGTVLFDRGNLGDRGDLGFIFVDEMGKEADDDKIDGDDEKGFFGEIQVGFEK